MRRLIILIKTKHLNNIVIISLSLISITIFIIDRFTPFLNDFLRGFTLSFGLFALIIQLAFSISKSLKNKQRINLTDERLKMINNKTFSYTYYFHLILSVLIMLVCSFFEKTMIVTIVLAYIFIIEQIFTIVTKYILNKKN